MNDQQTGEGNMWAATGFYIGVLGFSKNLDA